MSEEQTQQSQGSKSFSTTEVNLFDDKHSALAVSSMCSFYKTDILLEFRPLDTSSSTVKYINDKDNMKISINIAETPALIRQLDAFLAGTLAEFTIEHHGARVKRNLTFVNGNEFYNDETSDDAELVALCADSRAIYIEDVSSDDVDDHFSTVFIDYGTEVDLGDESELIFSNIEVFKSAIEQLYGNFMRFDFTSTRLSLANNSTRSGGSAQAKRASQPSRPSRRPLTKSSSATASTGRSAAAKPQEQQSDVETDLNSMFEEDNE